MYDWRLSGDENGSFIPQVDYPVEFVIPGLKPTFIPIVMLAILVGVMFLPIYTFYFPAFAVVIFSYKSTVWDAQRRSIEYSYTLIKFCKDKPFIGEAINSFKTIEHAKPGYRKLSNKRNVKL